VQLTREFRRRDARARKSIVTQSQMTGGAMLILRFKIHSKPDKSDELMAALAEIITPARATEGVSG
jgi:hypothetical protein